MLNWQLHIQQAPKEACYVHSSDIDHHSQEGEHAISA